MKFTDRAVCCSLPDPHLSLTQWRRTENSIPLWLLDVNSESKSIAGAHSQNCNWAKGAIIIYTSWGGASDLDPNAVHLNGKKLTSASSEIHSNLQAWKEAVNFPKCQSAGIGVDSSFCMGRFEGQTWKLGWRLLQYFLFCRVSLVGYCFELPTTSLLTWSIYKPGLLSTPTRGHLGTASFSSDCVVEKLEAMIKETKWKLEMLYMVLVNSITTESKAESQPDLIKA